MRRGGRIAAQIEKGWQSAERGDTIDEEEIFDQLIDKLKTEEVALPAMA